MVFNLTHQLPDNNSSNADAIVYKNKQPTKILPKMCVEVVGCSYF
jgi:hypothetical protein